VKNANPVSRPAGWVALVCASLLFGCGRNAPVHAENRESSLSIPAIPATASGPVAYTYEVIGSFPHDRAAFTQGLVFRDGVFLESTGLYRESTLREVEPKTGRVLKQVALPPEIFAEGLVVLGGRAYQLSWQNHRGFVYDADTFRLEREFTYEGEGWGLATDGHSLILSDGTSQIRFLDPATFKVTRTIDVSMAGQPVANLNELEWVRGEIFANVWQTNRVVRIDPTNGKVHGFIEFTGLLPTAERTATTDVLNGIAYDPEADRLFITGKRWPKIFEVRLKPRP
jgi:glutamine cyclotransferase